MNKIAFLLVLISAAVAHAEPGVLTLPDAKANPTVTVIDAPAPSIWPAKIGLNNMKCQSGHTTPEALLGVRFLQDGLVTVIKPDAGAVLWEAKGRGVCGTVKSDKGDFPLRLIGSGKPARKVTLQVAIANRPIRFPGVKVLAVDGDLAQPRYAEVAINTEALSSDQRRCLHWAYLPSLIVKRTGAQTGGLRLRLVGAPAGAALKVVGPLESMSADQVLQPPTCDSGYAERTLDDTRDGSYAVYLGYPDGKPFDRAFVVLSQGTPEPLSLTLPVRGDELAARAADVVLPLLDNWNPYFSLNSDKRDELLGALLEHYPAEALVFAARDLDQGVKADEPVLLLTLSRDSARVVALDGTPLEGVGPADLRVEPAGAPVFPTSVREEELSFARSRELAGPEDAPLTEAFEKASARYEKCADKIWKKMVGDLPYDWDLLIIRGTRSTSVKESAQRKIDRTCGSAKMEKAVDDYIAGLRRSRSARRLARIQQLAARWAAR